MSLDLILIIFVLISVGIQRLIKLISGQDKMNRPDSQGSYNSGSFGHRLVFGSSTGSNYRYDKILSTFKLDASSPPSNDEIIRRIAPMLDGGEVRARQFLASPYVQMALGQHQSTQPQKSTFSPTQTNQVISTQTSQHQTSQVTKTSSNLVEQSDEQKGAVFWDESF